MNIVGKCLADGHLQQKSLERNIKLYFWKLGGGWQIRTTFNGGLWCQWCLHTLTIIFRSKHFFFHCHNLFNTFYTDNFHLIFIIPAILWETFCIEQIYVTLWNFTLDKFTQDLRKGFAHACSAVLTQRKIKNLPWKIRMWLNLVKSLNKSLGSNIKHRPILLTRDDQDCDVMDRHCKFWIVVPCIWFN